MEICYRRDGILLVFEVDAEGRLLLLHCGEEPYCPPAEYYAGFQTEEFRAVEIQLSGRNHNTGHGRKYVGTSEGRSLRYVSHENIPVRGGEELVFTLQNESITAKLHYRFFGIAGAMESYTEVFNRSDEPLYLEYVSSFCLYGLARNKANDYDDLILYRSSNTSYRENQWLKQTMRDYGLVKGHRYSTAAQKVCVFNNGSWSTCESLPKAVLQDSARNAYMLFDIQSNSGWCYEIGEYQAVLYLLAAGGSFCETAWLHRLAPGERYESDRVALFFGKGLNEVFSASVLYKRRTRLPSVSRFADKIIYNPYMHNAGEDPSEAQTLRDIESVKDLDIDIFCIDAGWHDEADYWKAIGNWEESKLRFPGGLAAVTEKIRACGMQPGLWMEPEMMGWFNPRKTELPDNCYFCRGGAPAANNGRIQLDFRRSLVRERLKGMFDRIIGDYGLGYMKFDFNADCVVGTEVAAASPGDGLKRASEAAYRFFEGYIRKRGDVMFENCASGGMRLDGRMQCVYAIHSTSDQVDYRLYPYIASNMLTNGAPEQMGVWCYPLEGQTEEQTVMNVVNTALGRMQLSGNVGVLTPRQKEIIAEGIAFHRRFSKLKQRALPVFPLGLNEWGANTLAAALCGAGQALLAVWHFEGEEEIEIPLEGLPAAKAECVFPAGSGTKFRIDRERNCFKAGFSGEQARVFLLR